LDCCLQCIYLQVAMFASLYDFLHTTIDMESIVLVMAMFETEGDSFVYIPKVQTQKCSKDCGLFAIVEILYM